MRPEHEPKGDPCSLCDKRAFSHRKRPEHKAQGNPCVICGIKKFLHRPRIRQRKSDPAYWKKYNAQRVRAKSRDYIIGIDGEGQGRNKHKYVFLAASSAKGVRWCVDNYRGLSTRQCLDFILSLPTQALIFGFALQYDFTKALANIPNFLLYKLFHEKTRIVIKDGKEFFTPITWKGYKLNYINGKLTVERGKKQAAVWDIFRFFQSKFTKALEDWKIGTADEIKRMAEMKEKRSDFDKLDPWDVERYCFDECEKLSQLGHSLLKAHDDAGLPLTSFYGAGSTASAFLKKIDIVSYMKEPPEEMRWPIACSFFGGRFEGSVTGPIVTPVEGWDVYSAYPYCATFLPCLVHGRWIHVTNNIEREIEKAPLALIHWTLPYEKHLAWGPFPVRTSKGSIVFPSGARGGWCWKEEFKWGKRLCPWARAREAWIFSQRCSHMPFKDVPTYYRERLKLGKDAKGIVIKLGLNSGCYGKLVQTIGLNPPFLNWVMGANVTSGCRAKMLEAIVGAKDPWDIYMIATDGIQSNGILSLTKPKDTGTADTPKPLGDWEHKTMKKGVFYVRPGVYFPLNPTKKEIQDVRARGLGRKILYDKWREIVRAWKKGAETVEITGITRFVGAKSALTRSPSSGIVTRSKDYGEWVPNPIELSFDPKPKRECVIPGTNRLKTWGYLDFESEPYDEAKKSPEAKLLELAKIRALEQPDIDFVEDDYVDE